MKDKVEIRKIASRSEAARILREFADQVEAGEVKVGDAVVKLPESFECELEYKVKDGKRQVEVEFEWQE